MQAYKGRHRYFIASGVVPFTFAFQILCSKEMSKIAIN